MQNDRIHTLQASRTSGTLAALQKMDLLRSQSRNQPNLEADVSRHENQTEILVQEDAYVAEATTDTIQTSEVSSNTILTSHIVTSHDLLQQAIQDTHGLRLDGPDMTLEEFYEQMQAEGHVMPNLHQYLDTTVQNTVDIDSSALGTDPILDTQGGMNTNVSAMQPDLDYTVHTETIYSGIQMSTPWNGPEMFCNDMSNSQGQIHQNLYTRARTSDTYCDGNTIAGSSPPVTQTVSSYTGRIDYEIKQVLRKHRGKHLVAMKADPITGARRKHKWIPAHRMFEIPENLISMYNTDKWKWLNNEIERTGRAPKMTEFQAEEMED